MNEPTCTDPALGEFLAAYEFGLLSVDEEQAFESHLARCDRCSEDLFEMAPYADEMRSRPRELGAALSRSVGEEALRPETGPRPTRPAIESVPRPKAGRTFRPKTRRPWIFASGLALTAAILLVVLIPQGSSVRDLADLTPLVYVPIDTRSPNSPGGTESFVQGMAMYAAGRFGEATTALENAIIAAETDPSVQLPALAPVYLGVAWLQVDRTEEAIPVLTTATSSPIPAVSERARWYLAQAHLLEGRPDDAMPLLESLVSSPVYAAIAAAQLSALRER